MRKPEPWRVHNKNRLLLQVMKELAGDAHISFEGDLHGLDLFEIPGASHEVTAVLRRNTLWPKQDFVIVPLEATTIQRIIASIGGTIPSAIKHIQIEKAGSLEFGAYDNFHPHAMAFGNALTESFMASLISDGLLERLENNLLVILSI